MYNLKKNPESTTIKKRLLSKPRCFGIVFQTISNETWLVITYAGLYIVRTSSTLEE